MGLSIKSIKESFKNNSLYKDSFWAVFGNGIGNFLLLLSGIIIARLLGKDLFGEYGMVKTTMFTMATFSTLALGNSSTKFVAEYLQKDLSSVKSIISTCIKIVLIFSLAMCMLLFIFASTIADFVNEPRLELSFRFLGFIIVFRALNTLGAGILGGLKKFKQVGINNIIAGSIMFSLCIPMTKLYSLTGAFICLLSSQVCLCLLNIYYVYRFQKPIDSYSSENFGKSLLSFTFPFAINELVYTFTTWGNNLFITKYSTLGDLGILTACMQWNSIVLFMPGLLANVILSYLSTSAVGNGQDHQHLLKRMLIINLISTLIPLVIVIFFSKYITSYYGESFRGMEIVLLVALLGTVFTCLSRVFDSNLMSEGRRWTAFSICSVIYIIQFILTIVILKLTDGYNAAVNMATLSVVMSVVMLLIYVLEYKTRGRKNA